MRSNQVWIRSKQVVRASDSQCWSCNYPGFDPPTQWNLEGGRWSSVVLITEKIQQHKVPLFSCLTASSVGFPWSTSASISRRSTRSIRMSTRSWSRRRTVARISPRIFQVGSFLSAFLIWWRLTQISTEKVMGRKIYFYHKIMWH